MSATDLLKVDQPFVLRPYTAYTYAYPHKTAYRPLEHVQCLSDVWANEDRQRLFLYVHIPFCEVRCGFCNLFTTARPGKELTTDYLQALQRQMRALRRALPDARFVRLAIGGGTPTYLNLGELSQLFELLQSELGVDARHMPASCEASPATIDRDKLQLLQECGIDRISMGVQSFKEAEAAAMGRPQRSIDVERALQLLDEVRFPSRNLDLIYGADNQSVGSFLESVQRVIDYGAEELFLYPLYVRQLTGLGRRSDQHLADGHGDQDEMQWDRARLECYQAARESLLAANYRQQSMRNFLKGPMTGSALEYCCQTDGMIGLGCGARSYTRQLHYSNEYAVGSTAIKSILLNYLQETEESFGQVHYGFALDRDEQQRRHLLMSLLQVAGVDRSLYAQRFGTDPVEDFPQLLELEQCGWAQLEPDRVQLTPEGLAWTDAIGPWLYSASVNQLSRAYQWQ